MGDSSDLGKIALGVATGGISYVADEAFIAPARRQARVAKKDSKIRRRAADIGSAGKERERQLAVRQQARQERIRRAQVLSAAEASGVSGSSVETSTIGSGQTIGAAGSAFATGATLANQQVSSLNQQSADLGIESQKIAARGQAFQSAVNLGMSAFSVGASIKSANATDKLAAVNKMNASGGPSAFANIS
jgi:hypothetical protein